MSARLTRRAALIGATAATSLAAAPIAEAAATPRPSRVERVHAFMTKARANFEARDAILHPADGESLDPDQDLLLIWSGIFSAMAAEIYAFDPTNECAALIAADFKKALDGTLPWGGAA